MQRGDEKLGDATLSVPGKHNVSNALGVIALATELGIPFEKIAKSLGTFRHARRRFEIKYQSERFLLVDDYAHHPTEIRATLATAKSAGRKRVLTMFQPHRYSRTKALRFEFGGAFDDADHVVITDVYPASEAGLARNNRPDDCRRDLAARTSRGFATNRGLIGCTATWAR